MTGTIRQYYPAYFSEFMEEVKTFTTLKELFNIEWVDSFSKLSNGEINPKFYRYSISIYPSGNMLMAEYDGGYEWWVIGYVDENDIINELPVFKIKYKRKNHQKSMLNTVPDAIHYLETQEQTLKGKIKECKAINKILAREDFIINICK